MRVTGESMTGAGILDGDLVVVDRSLKPQSGHIVMAVCGGEMTIKRLRFLGAGPRGGRAVLQAEHPDYPSLPIGDKIAVDIWGVVAGVVRKTVWSGAGEGSSPRPPRRRLSP